MHVLHEGRKIKIVVRQEYHFSGLTEQLYKQLEDAAQSQDWEESSQNSIDTKGQEENALNL